MAGWARSMLIEELATRKLKETLKRFLKMVDSTEDGLDVGERNNDKHVIRSSTESNIR